MGGTPACIGVWRRWLSRPGGGPAAAGRLPGPARQPPPQAAAGLGCSRHRRHRHPACCCCCCWRRVVRHAGWRRPPACQAARRRQQEPQQGLLVLQGKGEGARGRGRREGWARGSAASLHAWVAGPAATRGLTVWLQRPRQAEARGGVGHVQDAACELGGCSESTGAGGQRGGQRESTCARLAPPSLHPSAPERSRLRQTQLHYKPTHFGEHG